MKALSIGLVIFILTPSAWSGTFLEIFDGGDINKWEERIILGLGLPVPRSWEIVDGHLQSLINDDERVTRLLMLGDETWKDYDFEIDVKPLRKHGPGHIVIASRIYQNRENRTWGVLCTIGDSPIPEPESMARCFGGALLDGEAFLHFERKPYRSLQVRRWSHLKLSVHGKLLTFWINGKQVLGPVILEAKHGFPDYPKGKVGFGVSNYSVLFDNITITGNDIPNQRGLSVTPSAKLATTWGHLKQL